MAILRANTSFNVGRRRFVKEGDLLDDKDPIVKGRERLFDDVDEYVQRQAAKPTSSSKKASGAKKAAAKKA